MIYTDSRGERWHVEPAYVGYSATHEQYDGAPNHSGGPPADQRHLHAPTAKDVCVEVECWVEEQEEQP